MTPRPVSKPGWIPRSLASHLRAMDSSEMLPTKKIQQVSQSALCRAVQDGFLLSDLPDLQLLLLVKLIAQTQANICLSCPISCSTTPGVTCTSSARHPCTSSMHIVHTLSVHCPHVICTSSACCPHVICACAYVVRTRTHHPHIVCRPSAPLLMVTMGLNYLLL